MCAYKNELIGRLQPLTYSWLSKYSEFFVGAAVLYLPAAETLTLQPQGLHRGTDLLKYVIWN